MRLRRLIIPLSVLALAAGLAGSARAITGGTYDGNAHPYVGISTGVSAPTPLCSGFLVSPRVYLTSGHCAPSGTRMKVLLDPRGLSLPPAERVFVFGTAYRDPQFCTPCKGGGGIANFMSHDLSVVILDAPGASVSSYAQLPAAGAVDSLPMGQPVDLVGFGYQLFAQGGGQPAPAALGTRYVAEGSLIQSNDALSDEFLKLGSGQAGGICFGDSGGPNLLAGTNVALGVSSFVLNDLCKGVAYSTRLDTASAQSFIASVVSANS